MTAAQRTFLVEHGRVPPEAVDPANQNVAQLQNAAEIAAAGREALEHGYTTNPVTGDGPLPGLHEVLAAMPADYHPLDVASFMTAPHEDLNDLSPVDWLAGGGSVDTVVHLADELSYQ